MHIYICTYMYFLCVYVYFAHLYTSFMKYLSVLSHMVCILILSTFFSFIKKYICSYPLNLEKAMATHSSTLAWKIPWTEEPG